MGVIRCCTFIVVIIAMAFPILRALKYIPDLSGTLPIIVVERNFDFKDIPNLSGKTVVITGANAGLGFESARQSALKGARTVMVCRKSERCSDAADRIQKEAKSPLEIVQVIGDLSSLKDVQKIADEILKQEQQIDSLILNAGLFPRKNEKTVDGIELSLAVTHVAHQYLTMKVLPLLKKPKQSTVVVVSSCAHSFASLKHIESEAALEDPNISGLWSLYGRSKLANVYFAVELNKRLGDESIYVNAIHPGAVKTSIGMDRTATENPDSPWKKLGSALSDVFLFPTDEGALTQLYAAYSPEIVAKDIRGQYMVPIGHVVQPDNFNETLIENLWQVTEKMLHDRGFKDF